MQANTISRPAAQLDVALRLAAVGLPVFPVNPKTGVPPITEWPDLATTDPDQIKAWWRKHRRAAVGLVTGERSGIAVLDLDRKNGKDGVAALEAMGLDATALSPVIVETPSGGLHLYFRWPEGLRSSGSQIGAGVDIKGIRGFVYAPGAVKAAGEYRPVGLDLAEALGLVGLGVLPEWPDALLPPERPAHAGGDGQPSGLPLEVLEAALMALPVNARESDFGSDAEWFKVARIIYDETGGSDEGRDLWHRWSEGWGGYDYDEAEKKWNRRSTYASGRATVWSIITAAERVGWSHPVVADLRAKEKAARAAEVLPDEEPGGSLAAIDAMVFGPPAPVVAPIQKGDRNVPNLNSATFFLLENLDETLPGLGLNLMSRREEWAGGEVDDSAVDLARYRLERVPGMEQVSADIVHRAVSAVARHRQYHPIREWLEALRHDGRPRLNSWLVRIVGAEDSPYTRAVGRAFLVAMVARVMRPGCKVDTTLALTGAQGIGKSTLCRVLAGDAYFSASLPSITGGHGDRDAREHLVGMWLVELAEMAALRRSEVEVKKSFMTAAKDRVRLAYGRRTVELPRQCVFIGTTNEAQFLNDPTGNRRYWPVACGDKIDTRALAAERDQLFAEAVAAFNAGESWWFDSTFEAEHVRPVQEAAREIDVWVETVRAWLDVPVADFDGGKRRDEVTLSDIMADALGIAPGHQTMAVQKRAANVMREIGWDRVKSHGRMVWRRPE